MTVNEDMEIKTGPDDLAWSPDGESIAIVALLEDFYNLYEVPVEGLEVAR